jgi:hypothetical protein
MGGSSPPKSKGGTPCNAKFVFAGEGEMRSLADLYKACDAVCVPSPHGKVQIQSMGFSA